MMWRRTEEEKRKLKKKNQKLVEREDGGVRKKKKKNPHFHTERRIFVFNSKTQEKRKKSERHLDEWRERESLTDNDSRKRERDGRETSTANEKVRVRELHRSESSVDSSLQAI